MFQVINIFCGKTIRVIHDGIMNFIYNLPPFILKTPEMKIKTCGSSIYFG